MTNQIAMKTFTAKGFESTVLPTGPKVKLHQITKHPNIKRLTDFYMLVSLLSRTDNACSRTLTNRYLP